MGLLRILAVAATLAMAGCLSVGRPVLPPGAEGISYEVLTYSFCGPCDGGFLIVSEAGEVSIKHGTWDRRGVVDRRSLEVSPERYAAFRTALAPYRPQTNLDVEDVPCDIYTTHTPDIRVTWISPEGSVSRVFRLGCSNEKVVGEAIIASVDVLGLDPEARVWMRP